MVSDNVANKAVIQRVFISSTAEDLAEYRSAARDAALRCDCQPKLHEYWPARDTPPYDECMRRVAEADVLVVLVAHRHGWVPPDQPDGEQRSITRLECERAIDKGIDVLAFILDEKQGWPPEQREEHEITQAIRQGHADAELLARVQARVQALQAFKQWLNERGIRSTFTTPADLQGKVESALRDWLS